MENVNVSCDICKYGSSHDYIEGNYYCSHKYNPRHKLADAPMIHNCSCGEIDEFLYKLKYKPHKQSINVSKDIVLSEIDRILFDIENKDMDNIRNEINSLKDKIISYREPYKCETCAVQECEFYAEGCRDCSGWE